MPPRLSYLRQCGRKSRVLDTLWSTLPFDFLLPCLVQTRVQRLRGPRKILENPLGDEVEDDKGEGSSSGVRYKSQEDVNRQTTEIDSPPAFVSNASRQYSLLERLRVIQDNLSESYPERPHTPNDSPTPRSTSHHHVPPSISPSDDSLRVRPVSQPYQPLVKAFAALMKRSPISQHPGNDQSPPLLPIPSRASYFETISQPTLSSAQTRSARRDDSLRAPRNSRGLRSTFQRSSRLNSAPVVDPGKLVPLSNWPDAPISGQHLQTEGSLCPTYLPTDAFSIVRQNVSRGRLKQYPKAKSESHHLPNPKPRASRDKRPDRGSIARRQALSEWMTPKLAHRHFGTCTQPRIDLRDPPDDLPKLSIEVAQHPPLDDNSAPPLPSPTHSLAFESFPEPAAGLSNEDTRYQDLESSSTPLLASPSPLSRSDIPSNPDPENSTIYAQPQPLDDDSVAFVEPSSSITLTPGEDLTSEGGLKHTRPAVPYVQGVLSRPNPPPVREIFRQMLLRPGEFTEAAGLNLITYARRTGSAGFVPTIKESMIRRRLVSSRIARAWNVTRVSTPPMQYTRLPNLHMTRIHPPFAYLRPDYSHSDLLRHLHYTILNHTTESPLPPLRTVLDELEKCFARMKTTRSDRRRTLLKALHLYLVYCRYLPRLLTSATPVGHPIDEGPFRMVTASSRPGVTPDSPLSGNHSSLDPSIPVQTAETSTEVELSTEEAIERCWALIDEFVQHDPSIGPSSRTLHNTIVMLLRQKTPVDTQRAIDLFAITDTFERRWSTRIQDETFCLMTEYFTEKDQHDQAKRSWESWWVAWKWRKENYERDESVSEMLARKGQVHAKFAHTGRALTKWMRINRKLVEKGWVEKIGGAGEWMEGAQGFPSGQWWVWKTPVMGKTVHKKAAEDGE
ncbi:hypothetical protein BCR39DRAFT_509807 [Naematelia encephala]|uniref:Uncharacterized protein n=1 Tax=Naematelia encephala TaxID=71784 RepID=A0A1Y2BL14_9TREE|nr:hypothetical protein BCR39DRAFT_509807 [Naematelia encephala]